MLSTPSSRDAALLRVVLCACPAEAASAIARTLVEEELAACVNLVAGVHSVYWWDGKVAEGSETLLIVKTPPERYAALEARLLALHPYEVPEILALDVAAGAERYLVWAREAVRC